MAERFGKLQEKKEEVAEVKVKAEKNKEVSGVGIFDRAAGFFNRGAEKVKSTINVAIDKAEQAVSNAGATGERWAAAVINLPYEAKIKATEIQASGVNRIYDVLAAVSEFNDSQANRFEAWASDKAGAAGEKVAGVRAWASEAIASHHDRRLSKTKEKGSALIAAAKKKAQEKQQMIRSLHAQAGALEEPQFDTEKSTLVIEAMEKARSYDEGAESIAEKALEARQFAEQLRQDASGRRDNGQVLGGLIGRLKQAISSEGPVYNALISKKEASYDVQTSA